MRSLAILGSTGSIGKNCLAAVRHLGEEKAQVLALAAHSNVDLLEQQAKEFQPKLIAVYDLNQARELQRRIPHISVVGGMDGLIAVATFEKANLVISAMSGSIGLLPTISAIKEKKDVGFANKEVLVAGGEIVMSLVSEHQINLIPIDSELTAIFQCIKGEPAKTIHRILLTASGGPFRTLTTEQLEGVTVESALNHPNYRMGPKVTIDSSTLMNKGIEMIEAHWLFQLPVDKIDVVIHPQQMIHGMVEFTDNSLLAQMSDKDMIIPIQYAITYPKRYKGSLPPYDFIKHSTLQFSLPDMDKFPCLRLAYEAARKGGSLPCFMNAANEVLVQNFLNKEISWKEIAIRLEKLMSKHQVISLKSLDDVIAIDTLAREEVRALN